MRHNYFFNAQFLNYFWIIILFAIIILLIIYFINKKKINNNNYRDNDETVSQINSMLYQSGNGMKQTQIKDALNLPLDVVSNILSEMEKNGEIIREWQKDNYTFFIKKS